MALREPTSEEIRSLGDDLHLDLTDDEVEAFRELISDNLDAYETVRRYSQRGKRQPDRELDPGERARTDDPYNAWITRCEISGADDGPLAGSDVALKDSVAVAGVEMTCGSQVMEGYVPDVDATIVTRLLEAGGRIVGKTNMDDMAFTGNGHSSAFGPTLNPHDDSRLAGGSSGGSAIAIVTGEADVAIGTDQGGSIRVPAAWSGIVGHKPTHGLVPYTGIAGIENTIDYVGPMAADVTTTARALTVLAGADPDDPRQPDEVPTERYEDALEGDASELSIAVVEEGFERPEADERVNERVRAGLETLEEAGATVDDVSLPIHDDAVDIYSVALAEGTVASFRGENVGRNWRGWYNTSWVESFGKFRRAQGGSFPPSFKYNLLLGAYASEQFHSAYYARAMNLRNELEEAYDEVLAEYDVLAMPTAPQLPNEYVPDQDIFEFIDDAWGSLANACQFNATGHPAASVPVEDVDGLPVGLMLVGSHFDDATVLDGCYALECEMTEDR
ncbi:amidase [Natrarchaeobius chitinivorans]|uniref:Amidase n=1 Tax=Natrarchaeobius chitinivorans TaxID=1679083 RepID=A0A3N6M039_NATCH|nr:amidase [Natrarchaeobius chitinivorans]RQG94897.1 amidase [Natrarchaeobius chitinivorans]